MKLKGVLIMGFGGPDSQEAIEPFMTRVMGGRQPSPELLAKIKARYDLIGGKSPLVEITMAQAKALEEALQNHGNYRVYVGMCNWQPYIGAALEQMVRDGVDEACAISISPHRSRITTDSYEQELADAFAKLGSEPAINRKFEEIALAGDWYDHPLFIGALALNAEEVLKKLPQREKVHVIFSAHSLPVSYVEGENADPYARQVEATVAALAPRLGDINWRLAYQSKGGGQGQWLGPTVEEVLDQLAAQGTKDVLVVPIGFAGEHIETLYDIDIDQRQHAEALGLNFHRSPALNTSPKFIEALADMVRKTI
ncbi:MAG: ferrochelatase [Clostridia bacterium]|nr:ferrochelatase [Clostridia bacterium]